MRKAIYRKITLRFRLAGLTLGCAIIIALSVKSQELPARNAVEELRRHVSYLASDELTGRGVDTPGIKLAGDYIAAEFAAYGLKPGGDNSSYLQGFTVPVGVTVKPPSDLTLGGGKPL